MSASKPGVLTEQIIRGKTRLERLDEVKNLNLWGQDLEDVSIVAKLPNVEVLSLSVNRIASLRDFRNCPQLKELYLRKNEVSDVSEILFLASLKHLSTLWLCDNPCADHPLYRQIVARALPSVEKLDNAEISPADRDAAMRNPELNRYFQHAPSDDSRLPARQTPPPSAPSQSASARAAPSGPPSRTPSQGHGGGYPPAERGGPSSTRGRKNILYAVMALVSELDEDDLVYVKREIEQRLGSMGR